jgi:hypothetical protein
MPLSRDKTGGGTEANGSRSLKYCGNCYLNGAFTMPGLTVDQMIERVRGKMKEMGFPGFLSGFFTRNIPKLERWRNPPQRG